MERSDVVVIGGGIAGLLAAIWSAERGRNVRLLTYGQGALTVAGGLSISTATLLRGLK